MVEYTERCFSQEFKRAQKIPIKPDLQTVFNSTATTGRKNNKKEVDVKSVNQHLREEVDRPQTPSSLGCQTKPH